MRGWNFVWVPLIAASFALLTANAQSPAKKRTRELVENRSKLEVVLKLDRDVYFPGEDAKLTVRMANPTAQTLEVPEPFDPHIGGRIKLMVRNDRRYPGLPSTDWILDSPDDSFTVGEPPPPPAIPISPGEVKEKTLWASDGGCDKGFSFVERCHLPETQGEYRLAYLYHYKAVADFRIVYPKLERWTEVVLTKPVELKTDPRGPHAGKVQLVPRRVRAMVLSHANEYTVAVSRWPTGREVELDPSGLLTGYVSRYFGTYRRVATSTQPVTALQLQADEAENITLSYTLQDGTSHSLKFDSNRNVIEQQ